MKRAGLDHPAKADLSIAKMSEHLSLRELEQRHEKLKTIYQQLI